MTTTNNVSKVGLKCIGCGACEGVCPKDCIKIYEVGRIGLKPVVDNSKCIHCGICLDVCPVDDLSKNENISKSMKIYYGNSKNHEIYYNSSSGGIVSSLLIDMFEKNKIDAAVVTFYNEDLGLYGDIITTKEEVLKHSGSFYHPSKQLINIKKIKNYNSVAFVGLPCHNFALKRAIDLLNLKNIYIKISLFCTIGRMKKGILDFIKFKYGHNLRENEKVLKYHSRFGEKRLPGKIEILTNFEKYKLSFFDFLNFVDYYYLPEGCCNCKRLYGMDADISVGDYWSKDTDAKLAIISCNSELGIDAVKNNSLLHVEESNLNSLKNSQPIGYPLKYKLRNRVININILLRVIKLLGYLNGFKFLAKINNKLRGMVLHIIIDSQKDNFGGEN